MSLTAEQVGSTMLLMNSLLRGFVFLLACGVSCSAVGQYVPKVPNVDVSSPNRVLNVKADDVCRIDFRNIRMFGENSDWTARLKNGKYERKSDSGYEAARVDQVFCLNRKESGGQHAVVTTNWLDCGVSCTSIGVVQLFVVRGDRPVITQQFSFESHAKGTGATFDQKSLTLTITARTDDRSPNCCAKNLDVVRYEWRGNRFVRRTFERIPAPPADTLGSAPLSFWR